jgi:hypothetical protein
MSIITQDFFKENKPSEMGGYKISEKNRSYDTDYITFVPFHSLSCVSRWDLTGGYWLKKHKGVPTQF